MVNITRYHSKLYVRKLSFLSFCRFAETDKNDNSDKTAIPSVMCSLVVQRLSSPHVQISRIFREQYSSNSLSIL